LFSTPLITTSIHTISLHDALPILVPFSKNSQESFVYHPSLHEFHVTNYCTAFWRTKTERTTTKAGSAAATPYCCGANGRSDGGRSEEHTSELQSRENLVCRLLLEK